MDPFLGEIRMFAGNFAPVGWQMCDGTALQISTNDALFNLLGTTYGGDGVSTFNVPDLRGRVPMHLSGQYPQGQVGGAESVTLTVQQIPGHSHQYFASTNAADTNSPAGAVVGTCTVDDLRKAGGVQDFAPAAISAYGGSQPHDNVQPFTCINYIICTEGVYPPQS